MRQLSPGALVLSVPGSTTAATAVQVSLSSSVQDAATVAPSRIAKGPGSVIIPEKPQFMPDRNATEKKARNSKMHNKKRRVKKRYKLHKKH